MEKEKLSAIEKSVSAFVTAETQMKSIPDFNTLAERIASGEPAESYEDFFGEESSKGSSLPLRLFHAGRMKRIGGAAAAVLVVIAGGVLLNVLLDGSMADKQASESSMRYETDAVYEDSLEVREENSFSLDDSKDEAVSDSDMSDDGCSEASR